MSYISVAEEEGGEPIELPAEDDGTGTDDAFDDANKVVAAEKKSPTFSKVCDSISVYILEMSESYCRGDAADNKISTRVE